MLEVLQGLEKQSEQVRGEPGPQSMLENQREGGLAGPCPQLSDRCRLSCSVRPPMDFEPPTCSAGPGSPLTCCGCLSSTVKASRFEKQNIYKEFIKYVL